jgi:hypothetical protein
MFGGTRFLIQLFFKMKFNYICIRDNSHVSPANDSRMPLNRRNSFILKAGETTYSQVYVSAKRGGAVLFFTLLVLILNHSLFGQNEKPFNPVKGGNSKYFCKTCQSKIPLCLIADNGCWRVERLDIDANETPKGESLKNIRIGTRRKCLQNVGPRFRNWSNAGSKPNSHLQYNAIPVLKIQVNLH